MGSIKRIILAGIGIIIALLSFYIDILRGQSSDEFGYFQITGIILGILLVIFGLGLEEKIAFVLLIIGIVFTGVNIYGEFRSLRNPSLSEGKYFIDDIFRKPAYTPKEAISQLDKLPGETQETYAYRLTELVHASTVHYWENVEDLREYNHILPFYENYLIYFQNWGTPNAEQAYALCDPYQAIERGVVICNQAAQILVSVWDSTEKDAHMVTIDGHVVTEAKINSDKWWVLDADFGVVIEEDFQAIQNNPSLVYDYYKNNGYSDETANKMVEIYEEKGNYTITNKGICRNQARLVKNKWLFPLYATLPYLLISTAKSFRSKKYLPSG